MAIFAHSYMAVALSHIMANGHKPSKPTVFIHLERTVLVVTTWGISTTIKPLLYSTRPDLPFSGTSQPVFQPSKLSTC